MTFHQKIPFISFEKFIIFLSFFPPQILKRFLRPTVHLCLQTEHILRMTRWEMEKKKKRKKKDVYRFRKYITHSTRGHCVSRHVMRTEKSRTSADVAKKEKKETKESRHQRPQVGFLAYNTVRDSPETRFLHLLASEEARVSLLRFVILGQIIAPKTHTGMCETP